MNRKHTTNSGQHQGWVTLGEQQLSQVQGGYAYELKNVPNDSEYIVLHSVKITSYSVNGSGLDDGSIPSIR